MAKITPKNEKRKKWLEEKKNHSRVTRARTAQQKSPGQDQSGSTVSQSAKQSNSKHSPSQLAKSKSSPSSLTQVKDSNSKKQSATPTKSKYGNTTTAITKNDGLEASAAKKTKYQYVDAVEKLENSTSIHVPKKLVLFVGNLPEDITKEQLMEHFKRTGGVKSVKIPKHKGTETGKGFAYVEFKNTISHRLGIRLHNTTLGDRKIIVEFAPDGKMTEKKLNEKLQPKEETHLKMPFDT